MAGNVFTIEGDASPLVKVFTEVLSAVKKFANEVKSASNSAAGFNKFKSAVDGLSASFKNLSPATSALREIGSTLSPLASKANLVAPAIQKIVTALASTRKGVYTLKALRDALRGAKDAAQQAATQLFSVKNAVSTMKRAVHAFIGVNIAMAIRNWITGMKELVNTLYGFEATLKGVLSAQAGFTGSATEMGAVAAETGKSFEFVKEQSARLGTALQTSLDGFKKFSASAMMAGQSLSSVKTAFKELGEVGTVLHLTEAQMKRVYLAFEQMFSKGQVMSEELKRQLGDVIPGAVQLMAKSLGVTTARLYDMMKAGTVSSEAILPFIHEMKKTLGSGLSTALNSPIVAMARLGNAAQQLQLIMGKEMFDPMTGSLNMLANALQGSGIQAGVAAIGAVIGTLLSSLQYLITGFVNLVNIGLTPLAVAVKAAGAVFSALLNPVETAKTTLLNFGAGVTELVSTLGTIASALGFTAVVDAIGSVITQFSTFKGAAEGVVSVFATIASGAVELASLLSDNLFGTALFGSITQVVDKISSVGDAFTAVSSAATVALGLVTQGVAKIVDAIAGTDLSSLVSDWDSTFNGLGDVFSALGDAAVAGFGKVIEYAARGVDAMLGTDFTSTIETWSTQFTTLGDAASLVGDKLSGTLKLLGAWADTSTGLPISDVFKAFGDVVKGVGNELKKLTGADVLSGVGAAVSGVGSAFSSLWDIVKVGISIFAGGVFVGFLSETKLLHSTLKGIGTLVGSLGGPFRIIVDSITAWGVSAGEAGGVTKKLGGYLAKLTPSADKGKRAIELFTKTLESIGSFSADSIKLLYGKLKDFGKLSWTNLKALPTTIKNLSATAANTVTSLAGMKSALNGVKDAAKRLWVTLMANPYVALGAVILAAGAALVYWGSTVRAAAKEEALTNKIKELRVALNEGETSAQEAARQMNELEGTLAEAEFDIPKLEVMDFSQSETNAKDFKSAVEGVFKSIAKNTAEAKKMTNQYIALGAAEAGATFDSDKYVEGLKKQLEVTRQIIAGMKKYRAALQNKAIELKIKGGSEKTLKKIYGMISEVDKVLKPLDAKEFKLKITTEGFERGEDLISTMGKKSDSLEAKLKKIKDATGKDMMQGAKESVADFTARVAEAIEKIDHPFSLKVSLDKMWDSISNLGSKISEKLNQTISGIEPAKVPVKIDTAAVKQGVADVQQQIDTLHAPANIAPEITNSIAPLKTATTEIKQTLEGLGTSADLSNIGNIAASTTKAQEFKTALNNALTPQEGSQPLAGLTTALDGAIVKAGELGQSLSGDLFDGVNAGVQQLQASITAVAEQIAATINTAFQNLSTTVTGIATTLNTAFDMSSVTTALQELDTQISTTAGSLETSFSGAADNVISSFDGVLSKIEEIIASLERWNSTPMDDKSCTVTKECSGGCGPEAREGLYVPSYSVGTVNTNDQLKTVSGGGFPAVLHPGEAVVPLSHGRNIPIEFKTQSGGNSQTSTPSVPARVEGDKNVSLNIQIVAQDADSFQRSRHQVYEDLNKNVRRAIAVIEK